MKKQILLIFICTSFIFISCKSDAINEPDSLEEHSIQIDSSRIEKAFINAKNNDRILCLIVATTDSSYYKEKYFVNSSKSKPHDIMSATKSILSILVGIAIDKGFIPSVNQTIDQYIRPLVPDLDSAKGAITIHQLLSMSCGLAWSEIPGPSEFYNWFYKSQDHLLYILNKPFKNTPGQVFNYSDGAAHLMSVVLSQATDMTANEFADQYLFTPLGIGGRKWSVDNRGFNFGGVRLFLLPKDMVKIGMLILQKGMFKSEQIVPKDWVEKSTGFQITTKNIIPYGSSYGYYWWRGSAHYTNYFFANGHGGQIIFMAPDKNLVIVGTTNWDGLTDNAAGELWYNLISIIVDEILPAFQ